MLSVERYVAKGGAEHAVDGGELDERAEVQPDVPAGVRSFGMDGKELAVGGGAQIVVGVRQVRGGVGLGAELERHAPGFEVGDQLLCGEHGLCRGRLAG